jgi:hypothetical protein
VDYLAIPHQEYKDDNIGLAASTLEVLTSFSRIRPCINIPLTSSHLDIKIQEALIYFIVPNIKGCTDIQTLLGAEIVTIKRISL